MPENIQCILKGERRLIVGEGGAFCRGLSDLLHQLSGRDNRGEHIPNLRQCIVLAVTAGEVAAVTAEREGLCSRKVVIQRLFLDGIQTCGGEFSVTVRIQCASDILPNAAKSPVSALNPAVTRAQTADHRLIIRLREQQGFVHAKIFWEESISKRASK